MKVAIYANWEEGTILTEKEKDKCINEMIMGIDYDINEYRECFENFCYDEDLDSFDIWLMQGEALRKTFDEWLKNYMLKKFDKEFTKVIIDI